MPVTKKTVRQILDALSRHREFVVACHVNPEGDALGSALALKAFLEEQGKHVKTFCQDPVPHILEFLPGSETVISRISELDLPEAILIVDCAELERTGEEFTQFVANFQDKTSGPVINIDHHESNNLFGDINLVRPEASSTCEILYDLFQTSAQDISLTNATCLYTGLVHDTGSFQFPNTTARTLKTGASLVRIGVRPAEVSRNLYENQAPARLKLLALALLTLRFEDNGRRAEMVLTSEMFQKTGTAADAAEGFINYLSAVQGVEVAMLFREQSPKIYKVSFRSREHVDVGKVAASLGGGGHRQASGASLEGSLEQVRNLVHARLDQYMARNS
jgi:phosphoesterase RecJ-like protein